ncbi:DUF4132 domain-containing protein [Streptomyces sp. NPDC058284]|uniref:DUF4132 domain-containing protein n=1 Tax=unclassified Streptomyces TaxID=2593676 RepID=UPI0036645DD4
MSGHYPQHVEAVTRLAAVGDMAGLADVLLKAATVNANRWDGDGEQVLEILRALPPEERTQLAHALDEQADPPDSHQPIAPLLTLLGVIADDLPGDLLSAARVRRLHKLGTAYCVWGHREAMALVDAELAVGHPIPATAVAALRRTAVVEYYRGTALTDFVKRLPDPVVNPGEAWADRALADAAERGGTWLELLRRATTATSAKPTAAWEKNARAVLGRLDADEARETLLAWIGLVGHPRTLPFNASAHTRAPNDEYDPCNTDALRGLAWLVALLPAHPDAARALGRLVDVSLRKIPGIGPRNPKVANAGVTALIRSEGGAALAELARLASRVTYRTTLKLINTGLEERAAALGLSREEVEELVVPAYGLTEVGHRVHRFGECEAELRVSGTKAAVHWRNAAGKPVKTPPAAVRRDHPDELKELKAAVKDIDKMLSAQAERLDRQFLAGRTWTYAAWRARCLDHPLVGTLARRLLWTVDGTPCGYADGALRTLADEPVTSAGGEVPDDCAVELWHPVGREPDEVVAWQEWLERHGVTQPFKQAHREVYLLTDAERRTGTYSNRFAAHILRQHQFNSLATVRGWSNQLRLSVDDEYPPAVRELPHWGLRAEYWVEGVGGERWEEELTDAGSYLRIRTDQVRFYPIDAPQNTAHAAGGEYRMRLYDGREPVDALPLDEIPALVLSEVLRDVDLFVGVASVGNDPIWQDGGPQGRFREYWTSYSGGSSVEGAAFTGYLPFEGDRTLAVVLSKAMMLANDKEITDPTIRSQLG